MPQVNQTSIFQPCVRLIFAIVLLGCWLLWIPAKSATAQLEPDVRDIFQRLAADLDSELSVKFKKALKEQSIVVEFTPQQFRRFRESPLNPFDGLDEIDAPDGGGNIALRFELPSLRNRTITRYERQHDKQLSQLQPLAASVAESTVAILELVKGEPDRQLALGIIVDPSGLVITKASEIETADSLVCVARNQKLPARVLRVDSRNDVALLSMQADNMAPFSSIEWSDELPPLGAFLVTPSFDGSVVALGTNSTNVRSTVTGEQAFLGVQPQTATGGVVIHDVRSGSAAYEAGLRDGDIIFSMAGQPITSVPELVHFIRTREPGDQVEIEYRRGGVTDTTIAKLAGRNLSGERAARFKMMSRLGAIPSRRDDGFPVVFQHDTPLFPEQCGGPIVDLNGKAVGMNIARNGRAATYAIPSDHLRSVIANLKRASVASLSE